MQGRDDWAVSGVPDPVAMAAADGFMGQANEAYTPWFCPACAAIWLGNYGSGEALVIDQESGLPEGSKQAGQAVPAARDSSSLRPRPAARPWSCPAPVRGAARPL